MNVSHRPAELFAAFDEPDPIARAGFIPTIRFAERCALPALVAEEAKLVGVANGAGAAPEVEALSLVGGMAVAGRAARVVCEGPYR